MPIISGLLGEFIRGQCGSSQGNEPRTLLFFFMQVCENIGDYSHRSDDRCLLLLLSPHDLSCVLDVAYSLLISLLRAWDVEANLDTLKSDPQAM